MLDMDKSFYPDNFVVPLVEIVHDRAVQEIFRGCIRGCRFCQAGMIYRPVREKSPETINKQCRALCDNTGYDEVSLSSLSSSDYSQIVPLLDKLNEWSKDEKVSISLPSLRVDGFTDDIMNKIKPYARADLLLLRRQAVSVCVMLSIKMFVKMNFCRLAQLHLQAAGLR